VQNGDVVAVDNCSTALVIDTAIGEEPGPDHLRARYSLRCISGSQSMASRRGFRFRIST
jgi:hypothetical protein